MALVIIAIVIFGAVGLWFQNIDSKVSRDMAVLKMKWAEEERKKKDAQHAEIVREIKKLSDLTACKQNAEGSDVQAAIDGTRSLHKAQDSIRSARTQFDAWIASQPKK